MRIIRILGVITAVFATTLVATSVSACPGGYVKCGSACCPRR